jgi:hypothetical protein
MYMQGGGGTINGAVANLTSDHVRAAASLVKTGKIYSLAVITNPEIHAYPGRGYQVLTAPIYIGTGDEGHTMERTSCRESTILFVCGAASAPTWTALAISLSMANIFMAYRLSR